MSPSLTPAKPSASAASATATATVNDTLRKSSICGRSDAPGWRTVTRLDTALAAAPNIPSLILLARETIAPRARPGYSFAGRGGDRLRVDSENFSAAPIERIVARYPPAVMVAVYPVPAARTGDQVMVAIELVPGSSFDPVGFFGFPSAQPDLGTKGMPRFVRLVAETALPRSDA